MKKRVATVFIPCFVLIISLVFNISLYGKKKAQHEVAVKLERVEREPAFTGKFIVKDGNLYDSAEMAVIWAPAPQGFRFRIYNKQKEAITILWNECTFIDEQGNRHTVTHKGVKRRQDGSEEIKMLKPTVIMAGDNWPDVVFPFDSDYIVHEKELVGFSSGAGNQAVSSYGRAGLRIKPIFIDHYSEKKAKKMLKKARKKAKKPNMDLAACINTNTYGVELAVKHSEHEPHMIYRFFFRAHLLEK
jgi:hypothetical protein